MTLSCPPPVLRSSLSISQNINPAFAALPKSYRPSTLQSLLRTYATESDRKSHDEEQSTLEATTDSIKDTASSAADSVSDTIGHGIDSVTPTSHIRSTRSFPQSSPNRSTRSSVSADEAKPGPGLYVGNLYFEVTPKALREEFGRYGEVTEVKVIYDARGLSKGYVLPRQCSSHLSLSRGRTIC